MIDLQGVFAAAITPLSSEYKPIPEAIVEYLSFLAGRGCHGALLFGTTGEGPSFSPEQRCPFLKEAMQVRADYPDFKLLAGTGTPSLEETIQLTRTAFDLGMAGVVVLPPYYFRNAGDQGLFSWYQEVIRQAVPEDGLLLGYHIPPISGVALSIELLSRLKDTYPDQFAGLKDSSGNRDFARELGVRFGSELIVFTGTDRLLSLALQSHASGCITAAANLISTDLRAIWDGYQKGMEAEEKQKKVDGTRNILDQFVPFPPVIKALLARHFGFPRWQVCPPLEPISFDVEEEVSSLLDLA
jgi:4-hydroxy-tetrahydrodipicolinate synthase